MEEHGFKLPMAYRVKEQFPDCLAGARRRIVRNLFLPGPRGRRRRRAPVLQTIRASPLG